MKCIVLFSALCLNALLGMSQDPKLKKSKIITCKKVYMYYQGNTGGDSKKKITDSLLIPIVSDKYPELKKALSEEHLINDEPLINNIKRYKEDGTGITSLNYEVTFESKDILSVHLFYESMGAYPDTYQEWYTYHIHTGKLYAIDNEINATGLKGIFKRYMALLNKELKTARKDIAADKELKKDDVDDIMGVLKTSVVKLKQADIFQQYIFTKTGLLITSEQALPHATRCFEIGRGLFTPYAKLRPYKKPTAMVLK